MASLDKGDNVKTTSKLEVGAFKTELKVGTEGKVVSRNLIAGTVDVKLRAFGKDHLVRGMKPSDLEKN